ncbi:hypothetical protein V7014_07435, partial [Bacillus sp. JJ722]
MYGNSKSFITVSKDMKQLEKMWSLAERMAAMDPAQGTEGAVFALRELFSGDAVSMVERFEMPRSVMKDIKNLSLEEQLESLDKYFNKVGMTENLITKMGDTAIGKWQQVKEQTSLLFAKMGEPMLAPISKGLEWLITKFDEGAFNGITNAFTVIKDAIASLKPLLPVIAVFGTVVLTIVTASAAFSALGAAVGFLLSPLGLVAMGITALVLGFKEAYQESETFRAAVDKIVGAVKGIFALVSGDTTGGANILSRLGFSADQIYQIVTFVDTVKQKFEEFKVALLTKFAEMKPGIDMFLNAFTLAKDILINVFSTLWSIAQPILSGIGTAFSILGDIAIMVFNNIIMPAVNFMMQAFQTAWSIIGPILQLLGQAFGITFAILKQVWDTILKPFAIFLTGLFKGAFEALKPVLDLIGSAFEWLGDKISTVADWFGSLKDMISKFKPPEWITKIGSGVIKMVADTGKPSKSGKHAFHGERLVPYDGKPYTLHKGERVLTAKENRDYTRGGNGSVSVSFA